MPHLLIAGTTGSGKSVMTNSLIMSLLFRNSPSDMRMIIVDPKQVEMVSYNDIPHLLTPIITSTEKALSAMKWAAGEMDRRYKLMAEEKVKKISDYNKKMEKLATKDTPKEGEEDKGGKMAAAASGGNSGRGRRCRGANRRTDQDVLHPRQSGLPPGRRPV